MRTARQQVAARGTSAAVGPHRGCSGNPSASSDGFRRGLASSRSGGDRLPPPAGVRRGLTASHSYGSAQPTLCAKRTSSSIVLRKLRRGLEYFSESTVLRGKAQPGHVLSARAAQHRGGPTGFERRRSGAVLRVGVTTFTCSATVSSRSDNSVGERRMWLQCHSRQEVQPCLRRRLPRRWHRVGERPSARADSLAFRLDEGDATWPRPEPAVGAGVGGRLRVRVSA